MLDGMTNIKASEVLKEIKYYTEDLPPYSPDEVAEALDMAIKALEKQQDELVECDRTPEAHPTHGSTYGGVSWGGTYKEEAQPNRCDSCKHSEEQDGSNCYECIKGMADNFEAQPKTSYISVDLNKFAKEVAEKALDEITYEGKTIREWAEILVNQQPSEDCISREEMLKYQQYLHGKMSNEENHKLWNFIKGLPSVTPQRPKGKWIFREDMGHQYCCSECGCPKPFVNDYYYKKIIGCPYCLAEMSGGGEE